MTKASDIIADIRKAMALIDAMPPVPMLAKCNLLPSDHAVSFKDKSGREYVGASEVFWREFPTDNRADINPLARVEVVDIDLPSRQQDRIQFFGAMAEAMGGNLQ